MCTVFIYCLYFNIFYLYIIFLFGLGKFGKLYLKNHERIKKNNSRKRQLFPKKNKKPLSNGPDADYGMAEPLPVENSLEDIENKKKQFLASFENLNLVQIEIDTREQANCQLWYQERKIRLTASSFGLVCKMRSTTSCKNSVYNILYAINGQAKSLQYGKDMENVVRKKAEEILNFSIKACGLFIDTEFPYLAASPGIV